MRKDTVNEIIGLFFSVILLMALFGISYAYMFYIYEPAKMKKFAGYYLNKNYATATCTQGQYRGKSEKKFSFTVNGKNYTTIEKNSMPVLASEAFLIVYNPENINETEIIYSHPIIKDSSVFNVVIAKKIEYGYRGKICFNYSVNNEKFFRDINSNTLFPDRYKKIDAKKTYKIIYNINDPRIAYPILEDSLIPRVKF